MTDIDHDIQTSDVWISRINSQFFRQTIRSILILIVLLVFFYAFTLRHSDMTDIDHDIQTFSKENWWAYYGVVSSIVLLPLFLHAILEYFLLKRELTQVGEQIFGGKLRIQTQFCGGEQTLFMTVPNAAMQL